MAQEAQLDSARRLEDAKFAFLHFRDLKRQQDAQAARLIVGHSALLIVLALTAGADVEKPTLFAAIVLIAVALFLHSFWRATRVCWG